MDFSKEILYIGVDDRKIDIFESQYTVKNGVSYNSYVIMDEKIAVMDTVDAHFSHEWLDNLDRALDGRKPDYLIVQHMEPDHSANIDSFLKVYPGTTKGITYTNATVRILSALNEESSAELKALSDELSMEYIAHRGEVANKNDLSALFNLGYGLYVVTSNDGKKDNGLIVNTVTQVTNEPNRVAVVINKQNYSHHVIRQTGIMNVNCLSIDAPFKVFEVFGFQSGRSVDKFADCKPLRSDNGLVFLPKYINSFMSLKVENYIDLGTHGMFICEITEARVISDRETMTYTYYQKNVKPKPQTEGKKGFVCKVCGYIYEGDELPEDYICPLCKHGAVDFEPIE